MPSSPTIEALANARASLLFPGATERIERARALIAHTLETYPGRVALSVSFGGASGMVLLDLTLRVDAQARVFFVDTELLFPETHALIRRVEDRYGIVVDAVRPPLSVAGQALAHGDALWSRDPDACCALRKVEPLRAYLRDADAWMTGTRREQSATRAQLARVGWDATSQVVKVAPLADWSSDDVWAYIAAHGVPVNALLHDGYRSIGCSHCTARGDANGAERDGRWAGFAKTECGIHLG